MVNDKEHNSELTLTPDFPPVNVPFTMIGKLRTKEKCPRCKGKFESEATGLVCPTCLIVPKKFYIDLHYHGKRIRIFSDRAGVPFTSYIQALRTLEHIRYEIDNHIFDPRRYTKKDTAPYRIENYAEMYIKTCEMMDLKPSTMKDKKRIMRKNIIRYFKGTDIRDIRSHHVTRFFTDLPKHLKPKTRRNIISELHTLLAFAHTNEDIEKMPVFPEIKPTRRHIEWIDEKAQNEILDKIPEFDRPIYKFIISYGCRPSEARALMLDCLDFENDLIMIRRNFSNRQLVETPKEGSWKALPMTPEIKRMLQDLIAERGLSSRFVFLNKHGRHYSEKISNVWRKAARKAGYDIKLSAATRHSFAMQRLNQGFSYEEVGAVLGHSQVSIYSF